MFNNKPMWIKSSRCAQGDCVLVAAVAGRVLVRDSKLGDDSPVLEFTEAEWQTHVLDEIRGGEWLTEWSYRRDAKTVAMRRLPAPAAGLVFTADEWAAFLAGVRAGEFDVDRLTASAVAP